MNDGTTRTALKSNWHDRGVVCSERWNLSRLQWSPNVSTARIAFCDSPFGPAVLKVSIEPNMVGLEARALAHFGCKICPQVYAVAKDLEAMLIERIEVLDDLSAWYPNPGREVEVWFPFYKAIESNPLIPEGFPTLATYSEVFERVLAAPLSARVQAIMVEAVQRRGILMGSANENRLLHGDLHHFNLLRDTGDVWRLIDPHGVVGHPYYELGAFLRNPWGVCYTEPGVRERLAARVSILSERLDISPFKVAEYGFYGAAFSIAWSIEMRDDGIDGMVTMAEACLSLTE